MTDDVQYRLELRIVVQDAIPLSSDRQSYHEFHALIMGHKLRTFVFYGVQKESHHILLPFILDRIQLDPICRHLPELVHRVPDHIRPHFHPPLYALFPCENQSAKDRSEELLYGQPACAQKQEQLPHHFP